LISNIDKIDFYHYALDRTYRGYAMQTFIEFTKHFWPEMIAGAFVAWALYGTFRLTERALKIQFSARATLCFTIFFGLAGIVFWMFPDPVRVATQDIPHHDIFYASETAIFFWLFLGNVLKKNDKGPKPIRL
jgi:predicted PurR-regulated permease PerM